MKTSKVNKNFNIIYDLKDKCIYLITKYNIFCLLVIFTVFLFSRLYHLDITPSGIHYDEAGMAFDAKSLAMYGTDRHNNSLPFYLPAYGGGQSALYAYTLALILKFIPFSNFVMRIPAVIYGCLAFFSSYFLVKEMFDDKRWALMGPILVTITPYFFSSERWALDCNLFLSLTTFSFLMYYRAHNYNRYRDFVFAGFSLGLTLYTYALSYIVLPVFLVLSVIYVVLINRDNIKKFEILKYVVMAVPLGIMALPLLMMQLINMGKLNPFKFLIFDFPKLGFYRGGEMSLSAIPENIDRIWMMLFRGAQFSFTVVPHFNPVYSVMVPFIAGGFIICVIGTVKAIKDKKLSYEPFVLSFTIAGYIMVMMITDVLNIYTGNELYIMYVLYVIICIKYIVEWFCIHVSEILWITVPVILAVLAVCFLLFSNYYFRHYNEECGVQMMFVSNEYADIIKYVNDNLNPEHKKVYFDRSPEHQSYPEVIVGMALGANPINWEADADDKNMVDNVCLSLPEDDIDMNEDCIWIFSKESHGHIPPYFIEAGWNYDDRWDSYVIIY